MKALFFISFLLSAFLGTAQSTHLDSLAFRIENDSLNPNLSAGESKFSFILDTSNFENVRLPNSVFTSVNGNWQNIRVDEHGKFSLVIEPGTYNLGFQLSTNSFLYATAFQNLTILSQHETSVSIPFEKTEPIRVVPCKPVIYFHTARKQEFDLSVNPAGNFTFVYPEMNDSWKGAAYPNGDLNIDGNNYPYLFWESSQQYSFHSEGNGYKVEKADVVSFLQKKLTELGLNQKEQTDFITYWGPKLAANESSFVQFSVDENCDQFATLSCSPQLESVHRVFIQIAKWDPYFELFLNDMTFSSVVNENWSLLEWGGFSFTKPEQLTQN